MITRGKGSELYEAIEEAHDAVPPKKPRKGVRGGAEKPPASVVPTAAKHATGPGPRSMLSKPISK